MDYQNKELVSFVIQSLKKIAKQYKALFVKFDPSLFLSKQLIGQENMETTDVQAVIDTLTKEGLNGLAEPVIWQKISNHAFKRISTKSFH